MLEASIQELTKAVNRLADIAEKSGGTVKTVETPKATASTPASNGAATTPAPKTDDAAKKAAADKAAAKKAADAKAAAEKAAAEKAAADEAALLDGGAEGGDEPVEITIADLRALGKRVIDAGKSKEMRAAITGVGGTSLTDVPTEKYSELKDALEALVA